MDKKEAIDFIKNVIKEQNINLGIGEPSSASWKKDQFYMTPSNWKAIGYVSAMSMAFDITNEDLEL